MPLAHLKRQAATQARATARADAAERELALLRADLDRLLAQCEEGDREQFPSIMVFVVRAALCPRSDCPMCISAYNDCPVHP